MESREHNQRKRISKKEENRRRGPSSAQKCINFPHEQKNPLSPRFLIFLENLLEVNFYRFPCRKCKNLSTRANSSTFPTYLNTLLALQIQASPQNAQFWPKKCKNGPRNGSFCIIFTVLIALHNCMSFKQMDIKQL